VPALPVLAVCMADGAGMVSVSDMRSGLAPAPPLLTLLPSR
jgi:hypothetical protein